MKSIKASSAGTVFALALFAANASGAGAQALQLTIFSGTTKLPLEAEWQGKTLPAGEYVISYGTRMGGTHYVEIAGTSQGSPHLFFTPQAYSPSSSSQDELVCVRRGNRLVILELQMSGIGESLSFVRFRGMQRVAQQAVSDMRSLVASSAMQIQRVPVATKEK